MTVKLSEGQIELILTSLEFTKSAFERASYPNHSIKKSKIKSVVDTMDAVRKAKRED